MQGRAGQPCTAGRDLLRLSFRSGISTSLRGARVLTPSPSPVSEPPHPRGHRSPSPPASPQVTVGRDTEPLALRTSAVLALPCECVRGRHSYMPGENTSLGLASLSRSSPPTPMAAPPAAPASASPSSQTRCDSYVSAAAPRGGSAKPYCLWIVCLSSVVNSTAHTNEPDSPSEALGWLSAGASCAENSCFSPRGAEVRVWDTRRSSWGFLRALNCPAL